METKRRVYEAAVLSVLLYGAEAWSIKAKSVRYLSGFHNRCIRTIMGVTRQRQWRERLSSRQLASDFGMKETMAEILMKHRLRCLGHLARMESHRMPKQLGQHRYGTYAANLSDSTELATIPVLVDGHSDIKETVPGTAAFMAVLL